ncbi:hypothetical protein CTA2_6812 [Colletotrichum tanaceti]|nr:hypothetical protein CTA2_6812 [Colletotrichum tanaceti]
MPPLNATDRDNSNSNRRKRRQSYTPKAYNFCQDKKIALVNKQQFLSNTNATNLLEILKRVPKDKALEGLQLLRTSNNLALISSALRSYNTSLLKQTPYAKAVSLAFAEETYRQLLIASLGRLVYTLCCGLIVPVYWVVDLDLAVTDPSAAQAESLVQRFRKLHLHKTSGTNEP